VVGCWIEPMVGRMPNGISQSDNEVIWLPDFQIGIR